MLWGRRGTCWWKCADLVGSMLCPVCLQQQGAPGSSLQASGRLKLHADPEDVLFLPGHCLGSPQAVAAVLRAGVVSTAGRGRTVSPCGMLHGASEEGSTSWGCWQKKTRSLLSLLAHTEVIGREENISLCSLAQMNNESTLTEHVSLTGLRLTDWNMLSFNY